MLSVAIVCTASLFQTEHCIVHYAYIFKQALCLACIPVWHHCRIEKKSHHDRFFSENWLFCLLTLFNVVDMFWCFKGTTQGLPSVIYPCGFIIDLINHINTLDHVRGICSMNFYLLSICWHWIFVFFFIMVFWSISWLKKHKLQNIENLWSIMYKR